jgi:hypothetical protein
VPILLGLCYASSRVYCRAYVSRRQHFHFRCRCIQSSGSPRRLSSTDRGPRQACLLGWKKSRTSLNLAAQSRSENALIGIHAYKSRRRRRNAGG